MKQAALAHLESIFDRPIGSNVAQIGSDGEEAVRQAADEHLGPNGTY